MTTTFAPYIMGMISNTPTYVWFLLAFLIFRGKKATKDAEVSVPKMFIVPSVFILWEKRCYNKSKEG